MRKTIPTASALSTKASKALDLMRARAVKADEARTAAAHHARAAQVADGCLRHSLLIRQPICVRAATRTMTARLG